MTEVADIMTRGTVVSDLERGNDVDVSVLVLITERPEPLEELYLEYSQPLRNLGKQFEFVFVAEPWARDRLSALGPLIDSGEPIRTLVVGQTMSEAALFNAAASDTRGPLILSLPAYYRVEAPALVDLLRCVEEGADLAVARRWPRRDSRINRLQNRTFHFLLNRLVGGRLHDIACGVRALRREVLDGVPLYGDFARFFPLLAIQEGYSVTEVPARQHERDRGTRVYGAGVYLRRLIDLLGLFFLLRFTDKPLRFFGLIGSALVFVGAAILGTLLIQRLGGQGIANRPLLLVGNLAVVFGVQSIALGLIGEMIVHLNASARRPYRLARDEAKPLEAEQD